MSFDVLYAPFVLRRRVFSLFSGYFEMFSRALLIVCVHYGSGRYVRIGNSPFVTSDAAA